MSMSFPKVSIITPSFNQGHFIEATIQSVLAQTYPNIEYIIVDGGSTDDTMTVVDRYRAQLATVFHEPDRGQSDAINKGFRAASGELVGWINSDDVLYSDCVSRMVDHYRQHPDGAVYYSAALDQIDEAGSHLVTRFVSIPNREHLLTHNYDLIQQGSFYPTPLIRQVGYVDETIHYCMDLDLWLRLLNHGPIYSYANEAVAGFRMGSDTKTTTGGHRFLSDIQRVLLRNGAPATSRAVLKTRYYQFKRRVKETVRLS